MHRALADTIRKFVNNMRQIITKGIYIGTCIPVLELNEVIFAARKDELNVYMANI